MRIVLGFLSGIVGMLAGWFGLAFLVMALAGPDRDGGVAMGAFFNIGPLGALIGFGVGVWLFVKFGLVLLRHECRRPLDAAMAPQQGHRGKVLTSARMRRTRMVAIESGMWRSGREGRSSGSIIVG